MGEKNDSMTVMKLKVLTLYYVIDTAVKLKVKVDLVDATNLMCIIVCVFNHAIYYFTLGHWK